MQEGVIGKVLGVNLRATGSANLGNGWWRWRQSRHSRWPPLVWFVEQHWLPGSDNRLAKATFHPVLETVDESVRCLPGVWPFPLQHHPPRTVQSGTYRRHHGLRPKASRLRMQQGDEFDSLLSRSVSSLARRIFHLQLHPSVLCFLLHGFVELPPVNLLVSPPCEKCGDLPLHFHQPWGVPTEKPLVASKNELDQGASGSGFL